MLCSTLSVCTVTVTFKKSKRQWSRQSRWQVLRAVLLCNTSCDKCFRLLKFPSNRAGGRPRSRGAVLRLKKKNLLCRALPRALVIVVVAGEAPPDVHRPVPVHALRRRGLAHVRVDPPLLALTLFITRSSQSLICKIVTKCQFQTACSRL